MATTVTDSASTAATNRPKVDYISALNAGSGLNTTQIVDTLVEAEVLPKQNKINQQVEEKNVSISSLGQVKNDFTSFDTNLAILADQNAIITASSSTAITVTPDSTASLAHPARRSSRSSGCSCGSPWSPWGRGLPTVRVRRAVTHMPSK